MKALCYADLKNLPFLLLSFCLECSYNSRRSRATLGPEFEVWWAALFVDPSTRNKNQWKSHLVKIFIKAIPPAPKNWRACGKGSWTEWVLNELDEWMNKFIPDYVIHWSSSPPRGYSAICRHMQGLWFYHKIKLLLNSNPFISLKSKEVVKVSACHFVHNWINLFFKELTLSHFSNVCVWGEPLQ